MGSVSSDHTAGRTPQPRGPRPTTVDRVTTPPAAHPCARGPLISVEGVPGVGKSFLIKRAVSGIDVDPVILDGFSRRGTGNLDLGVALLRALRAASGPDPFLRGGAPAAEGLLLLAIKRHDLDVALPELSRGRIVVEGRSVDTTAVCQAVQLRPGAPGDALAEAVALVGLAASFRPLPDLTILITDDPSAAIGRAQRRDSRLFAPDQVAFINASCALHEQLAATDPARYRVVDRRTTDNDEAVQRIRMWILQARHGLRCAPEPWQSPGACCMYCGRPTEATPA